MRTARWFDPETSSEGVIHMRRLTAIVAAVAAVAVLGIAATSASAGGSPTLADDVAARLGIAPEKLRQAFEDAITARIDAAVKAGKLTPEQGAKLKERLANAKGLGLRLRGRLALKHPTLVRGFHARAHRVGPIAKYLGITPQELRSELRAGKSLAQVATAHGKTVEGLVDAIVGPAKARLDRAVANGHLTRQRADELLDRLTDAVEKAVQRAHEAGR
jgi:polyhydroxyalkanoate synthesis regulator phasin